jgi:hypothetical protein
VTSPTGTSAAASHLAALDLTARFTTASDVTIAVAGLAGAMALTGHHDRAARLLGSAAATRSAKGQSAAPAERADIDRITALVRAALGEGRFAAEHARGARLTPDGVRSLVAVSDCPRGAQATEANEPGTGSRAVTSLLVNFRLTRLRSVTPEHPPRFVQPEFLLS